MGWGPSGADSSYVGPARCHKSWQHTSIVGLSLRGPTSPARSLLQHRLPTGSLPLLGAFICSGVGSSTGFKCISAPLWTSIGRSRTASLSVVFPMGCRGISVLASGSPSLSPSSLTLVSAELFSHTFSLLSLDAVVQEFFPFLNILPLRQYHCRWLPRPWPVVAPSLSWLVLALSGIGKASSSFSQKPPL